MSTTRETKHSPLPWRVFQGSDYADPSAESTHAIADADDWTIAVMIGDCIPDQAANAELIIAAVNTRAANVELIGKLVEALADMVEIVEDEGHTNNYVPQVTAARKILAETALARAAVRKAGI